MYPGLIRLPSSVQGLSLQWHTCNARTAGYCHIFEHLQKCAHIMSVVLMSERCKQAVSRKVARFILQYACVLDVLHLSRHMSCVIATY